MMPAPVANPMELELETAPLPNVTLQDALRESHVLVVGGAGFVGSNLCRALLEAGATVQVVDNLLSAEAENLPVHDDLLLVEGSISDDRVLSSLQDRFDLIFHLATFHGNQNSIADPLADHLNNTLTTLKLFDRIKSFHRLNKVVYSSAGCTVAAKTFADATATGEDAPVSLYHDSPYQISKIVGEFYANYYWSQYELPVVKARFQNVYGPGEVLGAGRWRGTPATVWRNVAPTFIYRALRGWPLQVEHGGVATRDFIHVDDIVEGLMRCAVAGVPGEVYNLASGVETSILDLAQLINRLAGNRAAVEVAPARTWDHSGKRFGDPRKAARELEFRTAVELETGLQNTINWTERRWDFITRCIERHRAQLAAAGAPLPD